ncbi:MAG: tyrosine--tRNA ligase [Parvularculaceae bacterium]|nr:tyrosine--tRNA ligase [Parvularculaceae bacterium]
MTFKSDFLNVMEERGFIHQGTNLEGLDERLTKGVVTGYIGFDATAKSLHAGSLVQIMLLHWLQTAGHKPIALMGGGTTKVGDPTGKDQQRALLTDADIAANIDSIKGVFEKFLTFGAGATDAVMVNNDDWLSKLGYVEFLRDYGTEFTINRMLSFDSVKLRLERESPMTFLEFNYMLMQAYDFHELYRRRGCVLQMGGSDQWGNIVNGVELCRRKDGVEVFGLTTPLLTTASGKKMGKTESGAVWLNADMLSPYDY